MNLLDDRLSGDLAATGSLEDGLARRILALAYYAKDWGAAGILYTCSAFGPAIDAARQAVALPTYKPNDAMFLEALRIDAPHGPARIGLLSTFAPSVDSMREELLAAATERGIEVDCRTRIVPGALEALRSGETALHDRLIAEQALGLADCDVVMLGQFSMARARDTVSGVIGVPVLSSPHSAVRLLQQRLANAG
ncbi:MAG: hydantoin racemase [Proteobacteria bacterium]|nr:hydantoin racemase [Pseudomonadota bacterium]